MPDQREVLVRKMVEEGTSDDDIRATLKVFDAQQAKPVAAASETPIRGMLRTAKDLGIGALKGAGSTVAGLGELAANAGAIPGVMPGAMFNPAFRHPAFQRAEESTTASNTTQRVGKVGEQIAELALPVAAGAKAVPRAARAAEKFQAVMSAAKDVPVNVEAPGQVALRIQQLAERGGTMPRSVMKLLGRVTNPDLPPMAYEEARDFASNISRLSADEFNRLTPAIRREIGNLRVALNDSVGQAAGQVGMRGPYEAAMREYANASHLSDAAGSVLAGAKKALPYAGGAGIGYGLASKLLDIFK